MLTETILELSIWHKFLLIHYTLLGLDQQSPFGSLK